MQENTELELEQLWYIPSVRLRARAATEEFYKDGELLLRRVDLFLRYELPERVTANEFNPNIAPISLSFVYIGKDKDPLLIRKIYIGDNAEGRSGAFFTHLIAGLPREFTARDAIRLWYCPNLWVESDSGKHPQDIYLNKIRYSDVRSYVQHSETRFNVAPVSEQLQQLLLLVLMKGLPPRILVRGHSSMIAPLIYGLTHALPMKLMPDLTFTTYVSKLEDSAAIITGTINGAELQDISRIQVQIEQISGPVPEDIQRYVATVVNALVTGNSEKFMDAFKEFERRGLTTVEDLINLFNRRFRTGSLTPKVLEDIFSQPAENLSDLNDPGFQRDAAQMLLSRPDYWNDRGRRGLQQVVDWLRPGAQSLFDQQTREALVNCMNGMIEHVFSAMRKELQQGIIPTQGAAILGVLAYPSLNPNIYLNMLTKWAHGSLYKSITSDQMWSFHRWLLDSAKLLQPQPAWEQISPWLHISTWDKLEDVLKLDLPVDWEHMAIYTTLSANREIPQKAYGRVKMREAKFTRSMQSMLRQGSQTHNQEMINAALRLFAAIIRYDEQDHSLPDRVGLLLKLLNTVPNDTRIIEALAATVSFASPYQLTMAEFDRVISGCQPEVLAASGASPSLMTYLMEYMLSLTPKKLNAPHTIDLLTRFQSASATFPENITNLTRSWLDIYAFLSNKAYNEEKLQQIEPALETLVPLLKQRGQNIEQTFVEDLLPHFSTIIENEHRLEAILDVYEDAEVVSRWDLLKALAAREGTLYDENLGLSRLLPYAIVGIREYAHSGQSKNTLDLYLQSLFAHVSELALAEVDKANAAKIWPETILSEWKGWRERSRPSLLGRIKDIFQSPLAGQQAGQAISRQRPTRSMQTRVLPTISSDQLTGSQPVLREANQQPVPATPWLGVPDAPNRSEQSKELAENIPIPASRRQNRTTDPVKLSISIEDDTRTYTASHYQRLYQAFILILAYWNDELKKQGDKNLLRPQKYELKAMRGLLFELKAFPGKEKPVPEKFVQLLIDDFIIRREIDQIRKAGGRNADYFLTLDNEVTDHLGNFQRYIGDRTYENIRSSLGEGPIKNALHALICRYHLLRYMIAHKQDFAAWLEDKRKQAQTRQ